MTVHDLWYAFQNVNIVFYIFLQNENPLYQACVYIDVQFHLLATDSSSASFSSQRLTRGSGNRTPL